jgi:hypothetical protein
LKVTDVSATLEPAPTVGVGGDLSITWTGPKQPSDFISIDEEIGEVVAGIERAPL